MGGDRLARRVVAVNETVLKDCRQRRWKRKNAFMTFAQRGRKQQINILRMKITPDWKSFTLNISVCYMFINLINVHNWSHCKRRRRSWLIVTSGIRSECYISQLLNSDTALSSASIRCFYSTASAKMQTAELIHCQPIITSGTIKVSKETLDSHLSSED